MTNQVFQSGVCLESIEIYSPVSGIVSLYDGDTLMETYHIQPGVTTEHPVNCFYDSIATSADFERNVILRSRNKNIQSACGPGKHNHVTFDTQIHPDDREPQDIWQNRTPNHGQQLEQSTISSMRRVASSFQGFSRALRQFGSILPTTIHPPFSEGLSQEEMTRLRQALLGTDNGSHLSVSTRDNEYELILSIGTGAGTSDPVRITVPLNDIDFELSRITTPHTRTATYRLRNGISFSIDEEEYASRGVSVFELERQKAAEAILNLLRQLVDQRFGGDILTHNTLEQIRRFVAHLLQILREHGVNALASSPSLSSFGRVSGFRPRDAGHHFFSVDYGEAEMRVMAQAGIMDDETKTIIDDPIIVEEKNFEEKLKPGKRKLISDD